MKILLAAAIVAGTVLLLVYADRPPAPPRAAARHEARAPAPREPPPRADSARRPPDDDPPLAVPSRPAPPPPVESATSDGGASSTELPKDPSARVRALEPLRRELFSALGEQQWRVERCGAEEGTVFVTVETLDGAVRIVDARVEEPAAGEAGSAREASAADPAIADCVRSSLVGNVVGAPSGKPGRRWELPFAPGPLD